MASVSVAWKALLRKPNAIARHLGVDFIEGKKREDKKVPQRGSAKPSTTATIESWDQIAWGINLRQSDSTGISTCGSFHAHSQTNWPLHSPLHAIQACHGIQAKNFGQVDLFFPSWQSAIQCEKTSQIKHKMASDKKKMEMRVWTQAIKMQKKIAEQYNLWEKTSSLLEILQCK